VSKPTRERRGLLCGSALWKPLRERAGPLLASRVHLQNCPVTRSCPPCPYVMRAELFRAGHAMHSLNNPVCPFGRERRRPLFTISTQQYQSSPSSSNPACSSSRNIALQYSIGSLHARNTACNIRLAPTVDVDPLFFAPTNINLLTGHLYSVTPRVESIHIHVTCTCCVTPF